MNYTQVVVGGVTLGKARLKDALGDGATQALAKAQEIPLEVADLRRAKLSSMKLHIANPKNLHLREADLSETNAQFGKLKVSNLRLARCCP